MSLRSRMLALAIATASLPLGVSSSVSAQGGRAGGGGGAQTAAPVGRLRFEYLGPSQSGRIAAAAGVAGAPGVYYAGAASGGVWKSVDGGRTWKPTFDSQPVQAIGSIAVARTNPNIVWVGTGEGWAVRDMDMLGDGVYKSTDAGETWTHMGLRETGRIGTIIIHPTNPDIVLACALGTTHAPQQEKGVFRTDNGGRTWERVLFVNDRTGCSGLQFSMQDPNIVLAGTWEVEMYTWVLYSGGMGSGVHISKDAGKTFTKITHPGLPKSPVGKIDVAIAPSDGQRMYALIQTGSDGVKGLKSEAQGSLWRSDDGGTTWRVMSWDRRIIGRAGYYIRIRVSPNNPDQILIANSTLWRSNDGGKTIISGGGGCGDCHDIWWDPNPNAAGHYIVTGDGGMGIYGSPANPTGNTSVSGLPIGQMYHVAVDERNPYWLYSDRQDDGSMRIASNVGNPVNSVPGYSSHPVAPAAPADATGRGRAGGAGAAPPAAAGGRGGRGGAGGTYQEEAMTACESGQVLPVPGNPNIIWGSCYGNQISVEDRVAGTRRSVSPWMHTLDHDPVGLKYRCHWAPPVAMDQFEKGTVYYGCQVIFRTRNQGQSWDVISPDLSTKDPKRIAFSGGVTGDNLGQFYGEVVFAITASKVSRGLVWAGTNDGKVWVTRNANAAVPTWVDVGKNIAGLREWGVVRKIDASTFDAGTAYVTFDYHLMGHHDPYIYKTTNYGVTWTPISDGLPKGHPLDYVMAVAENPHRKGMLFAGTGHGFFYSMNDGGSWTQVKDKLPAAPVTGIEVPKNAAEVAISTYGRGLWILRDIWELEQPASATPTASQGDGFQLYKPRPGVRTASGGSATFMFRVAAPTTSPIRVEVLNDSGRVINSSNVNAPAAGVQRTSWNLLYPAADRPVLRALPADNPHIWEGGRFPNGTRPVTHWGLTNWQPRAAPGKYTVRMTFNGKQYSQPFEIMRDPMVPGTDADLVAGTRMQLRIVATVNEVVDKINRIEILRKQVEDIRKDIIKPGVNYAVNGPEAKLDDALFRIGKRMYDVEMHFMSRTDLHSDDKWYVEKYKLYMNLMWLLAELGGGGGDVAGGAAYRPTDASVTVFAEQLRAMAIARVDFERLMAEVAAFNRTHAGKLPPLSDKLAPAGGAPGGG